MNKIKKGDQVKVITGRDKGKVGAVQSVTKKGQLIIEGINLVKKSVKPTSETDKGGIVLKSLPMHRCKVMLYDPTTERASRVGIKVKPDGSKGRYYKSNNEFVDV